MKTQRELLELAAKAAGMPPDGTEGGPMSKGGLVWSVDGDCIDWNPITDDGDALRLAVRLGIKVCPYPIFGHEKHSVIASRRWFASPEDDENTYIGPEIIVPYGDDPAAATRLAITRAAAAIGEAIP